MTSDLIYGTLGHQTYWLMFYLSSFLLTIIIIRLIVAVTYLKKLSQNVSTDLSRICIRSSITMILVGSLLSPLILKIGLICATELLIKELYDTY